MKVKFNTVRNKENRVRFFNEFLELNSNSKFIIDHSNSKLLRAVKELKSGNSYQDGYIIFDNILKDNILIKITKEFEETFLVDISEPLILFKIVQEDKSKIYFIIPFCPEIYKSQKFFHKKLKEQFILKIASDFKNDVVIKGKSVAYKEDVYKQLLNTKSIENKKYHNI